jgi:hypothetical protein
MPADRAAAGGDEAELTIAPALSPRDTTVFLLHTAAEIEHSLLVQYLYAAWSLPPDGPPLIQRCGGSCCRLRGRRWATSPRCRPVRFIGAPLNFEGEDSFGTDLYPFRFGWSR